MIRVENAAALQERLEQITYVLEANLQNTIANEASRIKTDAMRRCPVETGKLRKSIAVRTQASGGEVDTAVYSPLSYARHVELGTFRCAAKPFLAPAFRARKGSLAARVRQAVRLALKGDTK